MAFCTKCGANVTGAFCGLCGTPAAGATATPPPQPAAATPYGQPIPPGAPVVRKTSPIVWVLVIVLGLFILGGISVAAFVAFVAHRVHQAGVSFDRNHDGSITLQTKDKDGKNAVVQFGGKSKLPSWVPVYPGSENASTFAVTGSGGSGEEGGNFTFTTHDDSTKVKTFYTDKAKELGMKITVDSTTPDGGMIVATDEGDQRSLSVIVGGHTGDTAVNVTYGKK